MSDDNNSGTPPEDENRLIAERRKKLRALRGQGIAFPNDFRPDAFAGDLQREYADAEKWTAEALTEHNRRVRVAGRIMARRGQGKVPLVAGLQAQVHGLCQRDFVAHESDQLACVGVSFGVAHRRGG